MMSKFKKIRIFFGNLLSATQRRKIRKIISPVRRIGIKKQFTLISDDCWGGFFMTKWACNI